MSFSVRKLPVVLLTLLSFTATVCAQTTTKQPVKVARGTISGRVTIKDKGAPGVVVGLRQGDFFNPRDVSYLTATTDQDGYYRITNVAPGTYILTPFAPAFVMVDAKDTKAKSVLVGEDENVDGMNFALVRGGVITGRVTDADGRPVIDQQVGMYPADAPDKRFPDRRVFPVSTVRTDDRGVYRAFGLNAGRYKVAAGRSDDGDNAPPGQDRTSYERVFHPDVTDHAKAKVIEVSEGGEATNVDIALGRVLQIFSASGIATDSEKALPVPNLRFTVQRLTGENVEYLNVLAGTNNRGEFVIEGLIPGRYRVYLFPNQANELRAEQLIFDIVDQDVNGLTLRLTKGASVTGVVVLETEDKTALARFAELQLRAFSASTGGSVNSSGNSPVGRDGSFRMGGLGPGTHSLQLGATGNPFPPKGFSIMRIERDGIALRSLEIKDGEQITGLRVIVAYGTATIKGIVKLENGSLPEGSRIYVRMTKPGEPFSMMRPIVVDARGQFMVEGVSPGTYELQAMIAGPIPSASRSKREVTVQNSETTEVIMTIDLTSPAKP